jgi:hypothetical protein
MKTKALTAAQIDTLAQRLSEAPIEPTTSAKKAGDNLARLLVARIGAERGVRRRMIWNSGADFGSEGAGLSSSCYAAWR